MSYELYAFPLQPGEDPGEAYERLEDADEPSAPQADTGVLVEALATAVPTLTPTARQGNGEDVELNASDLQILVSKGSAAISIPYWDSLDGRVLKDRLGRIVQTLRDVGGFVVYDPQLDRVIDTDSDLDEVIETCEDAAARTSSLADELD